MSQFYTAMDTRALIQKAAAVVCNVMDTRALIQKAEVVVL